MEARNLQLKSVACGYDRILLKDINLVFKKRALTALIGPNGSGKSTLLKTIARVLTPKEGEILLDGKPIHNQRPSDVAKSVAFLPQHPVAPEGLTVRELVVQGRYPHHGFFTRWDEDDEKLVDNAMSITQTVELKARSLSALSGGQRQRAWVAMILAQNTNIILLDEPTTFLDLKVQVDLMELLADLAHQHNRTVVVVLHELNLAAAYADQLIMLNSGGIHASGTPSEVFNAANLKRVFDLDSDVIRVEKSGTMMCVPKRRR